jgi:hypothetical protein
MANSSSSFRLAGTSAPGSSGYSYVPFDETLKALPKDFNLELQSTMTPPNPQDNFLGLGITKEEALKADPTRLLVLANLAGRQQEDIYNDASRLKELMGVYGEFRAQEADKAQKMKIESQGWQALFDLPKAITAAYARVPEFYAMGRQLGSTEPIQRRVGFR